MCPAGCLHRRLGDLDTRCFKFALQLGGECQQLQRTHLAVLLAMLRQVGQCPSCFGAIDLHPTATDLNQVGTLFGGALKYFVGYCRVVEYGLPLHDRRCGEASAGGVVARFGGCACDRLAARECFGCDQLDANRRQRIDALQRRCCSLDVDCAVWGRVVCGDPRCEVGNSASDDDHRVGDESVQLGQKANIVREREGCRVLEFEIRGCAPDAAVVGIDELESERPGG